MLILAATPLVGGSRAGTAMAAALLLVAGVRSSMRFWRRQRAMGQLAYLPLTGMIACAVLAVWGTVWLGNEALRERVSDTREQLQSGDPFQGRSELYRDTWSLAKQEPVFGWGLGTYSKVFLLVRPRPLEPQRQYERSYADAHSDWLQAVVEVGFVGALLLALTGVLPLLALHAHHFDSGLTSWMLAGCGLILLYATVEFPFGNPAVVSMWWICFFSAIQNARLRDASMRNAKLAAQSREA
jgi:O-antigen ligase